MERVKIKYLKTKLKVFLFRRKQKRKYKSIKKSELMY